MPEKAKTERRWPTLDILKCDAGPIRFVDT